jgi:hypothetical protein
MNLQMPPYEGEVLVIALFNQVNAQVMLLAEALEKQRSHDY